MGAVSAAACLVAAIVGEEEVVISVAVLGGIVCLTVYLYLQAGLSLVMLKVARGTPADIHDLFTAGPYLFRIVAADVLAWGFVSVGLVLFVVPGVIFWLMFSQRRYALLDRDSGAIHSLVLSQRLTAGNRLALLGIYVAGWLIGALLSLATGMLAALVLVPMLLLMHPVAYLVLSGEPRPSALPEIPILASPRATGAIC